MNEQIEFLKGQIALLEKRIGACSRDPDSKEYASLMRLYLTAVKEYRSLCGMDGRSETDDPLLAFATDIQL